MLSCRVGLAKPEQEIYELVEWGLNVKRDDAGEPRLVSGEILFLDDQEKCCVPARARGWQAIRVDSTEQMVRDAGALLGLK